MELKICKDSDELTLETSSWCQKKIALTGAQSIYLPAGGTPIPLYRQWTASPPEFLRSLQLIQIDDILTGNKAGLFKQFFIQHLPKEKDHFRWIGKNYDQADLAILGLGLNGHIAFHEPELPKNFYSGCVLLSPKTCETLSVPKDTWGISYGASAFLKNTMSESIEITSSASEKIKKSKTFREALFSRRYCRLRSNPRDFNSVSTRRFITSRLRITALGKWD